MRQIEWTLRSFYHRLNFFIYNLYKQHYLHKVHVQTIHKHTVSIPKTYDKMYMYINTKVYIDFKICTIIS
jgi:hypothetical protein